MSVSLDNKIPEDIQENANFIVSTYQLSTQLEEETQRYVKGARDKGKGLEEVWKGKHAKKAEKHQELAQQSTYMAKIYTLFTLTTVASTIASSALALNAAYAHVGNLVGNLGNIVANQAKGVADHLSAAYTQPIHSTIETMTLEAQRVWEADKRANESREEALKSLQEKASSATQSATERLGQAFSQR